MNSGKRYGYIAPGDMDTSAVVIMKGMFKGVNSDYLDLCKTSEQVGFTEVKSAEDGRREITLMDNEGNVLDTYIIDPETGM